jgi:hypothetical protein
MLWQEKIALWNDKNLKYLKSLFPVRKSPDQLLTPIPEEKIEKPPEYFIRKLKPFANLKDQELTNAQKFQNQAVNFLNWNERGLYFQIGVSVIGFYLMWAFIYTVWNIITCHFYIKSVDNSVLTQMHIISQEVQNKDLDSLIT